MSKKVIALIISIFIFGNTLVTHAFSDYINIGDTTKYAIDILGSSVVFTSDSGTWFSNGQKYYYEDYSAKAYVISSGELMVSSFLVAQVFNTKQDDEEYVNVNLYAEENGKYIYCDDRGFVVISEDELNLSNSQSLHDNNEESDIIYRYMQFDRPECSEIISAISNHSAGTHPRIFMRSDMAEEFRIKIYNDIKLQSELKTLLKLCESYIDENGIYVPEKRTTTQSEGERIFGACTRVRNKIINMAVAYYATQNTKYLDYIWQECDNVLGWTDWNFSVSFLDSAQMGPGLALAYDILYDYMSEEQKLSFQNRMLEKHINYSVGVYTGESSFKITDGRMTRSNWGAVCGTSMLLVGLSFIDEFNPKSELSQKCAFLVSSALEGLEYPMGVLYSDGSVIEGLEYWSYYIEHLVWSVNALINTCGNDFGFLKSPGFFESIDFGLSLQTLNSGFNYATTPTDNLYLVPELFGIAAMYNDGARMEQIKNYFINSKTSLGARGLLFYQNIKSGLNSAGLKDDNLFGTHQIVTMRSSTESKDASYVGILGGKNETNSQFDKGSFVFETQGVRWICDLGDERKDVSGGYYHNEGWDLYKRRTEGHNCLIINPYGKDKVDEFILENDGKDYNVTNDDPRYVGQTVGKFAKVKRFESKPSGAIAIYDLADVYGNQVMEYQRGLYLGDGKKSLTLRDELVLTEQNSEIYWFLHSQNSEINIIDNNTVSIKKNDKTLICEILTNLDEYTLEVKSADPLDENFIRSGDILEYSRSTYKKLSLSANASGEVFIAARFYIENESCGTDYKKIKLSDWVITDDYAGTAAVPYENFKFTSSNVLVSDKKGNICISASVPYRPQVLNLYLNGEKILQKTSGFSEDGDESFYIDISHIKTLNAYFELEYIYGNTLSVIKQDVLIYNTSGGNTLADRYFDDISSDADEKDIEAKLNSELHLCYTNDSGRINGFDVSGDDNKLKLYFEKSGEENAGYIYKTRLGVNEGENLSVIWNMTTYDPVKMYFSAEDKAGISVSPSRIDSIPVLFGTYTYCMFLDGKTYLLSITNDDGELVYIQNGQLVSNNGGFSEFRLKFYGVIPKCTMHIENIKALSHSYIKPYTFIFDDGDNINITLDKAVDAIIYKAIYDEEFSALRYIDTDLPSIVSVNKKERCKIFALDENINPVLRYIGFNEAKENE